MTNKLFDDFIREKLKDHAAAIPADMWDKILQEKKKTKKGFFWLKTMSFLSVVILAVLFGWFGLLPSNSENILTEIKQPNDSKGIQSNNEGQTISTTSIPASTASVKNTTGQQYPSHQNKISENLSEVQDAAHAISTKEDKTSTLAKQKKLSSTISQKAYSQKQSGVFQATRKILRQPSSLPPKHTSEKKEEADHKRFADRLSLLAARQNALWNNNASDLLLNYKPILSSVDCPSDRSRSTHGFYVEFFGSPDIAFKGMTYKSTAGRNYANRKDSTATKQLSYTLGMRFTKEIGQNMLFKTGVQYSQINEKFDYRNENERSRTTVVTIRTITNSDGTTTTIRDTSIVEQVGYRVKTTYNRYRSFDIPVLLGYEFGGEGWKASINAGPVFNISSWQEGEFLDTSYLPVSFAKTPSPIFKSKTGISLYAGANVSKSIGGRTELFAEPYFRYSLTDRTTNASPFSSRFHVAGILMGIRFKLNGARAAK